MEYRTLVSEENDLAEGHDQSVSPFLQFETQEDENNSEKRKEQIFEISNLFFSFLKESQWSHQKNLDDFFARVYQYHQRHGFFCILLSEVFGLM